LQLKEDEVIRLMREHLEGLFPKVCNNCGRQFVSLYEYLMVTEHKGSAIPYDAELGDWKPVNPLGTTTYATCPCGNTLMLSSKGMPLSQLWPLLAWAKLETEKRGMSPQELLNYLRDEICRQVLAEQSH
jgi:hypothetical protein